MMSYILLPHQVNSLHRYIIHMTNGSKRVIYAERVVVDYNIEFESGCKKAWIANGEWIAVEEA